MPGGLVPAQSLVFLVTNAEGFIRYRGIDVTPEIVYATFLRDAGRRSEFHGRELEGFRQLKELTTKLLFGYDQNREIAALSRGLVTSWGNIKPPYYQNIKTEEVGGVFWTSEESLTVLDREGLKYRVLQKFKEQWVEPKRLTPEEVRRRMLEDLAKDEIK